jgi:hypothetical protein
MHHNLSVGVVDISYCDDQNSHSFGTLKLLRMLYYKLYSKFKLFTLGDNASS